MIRGVDAARRELLHLHLPRWKNKIPRLHFWKVFKRLGGGDVLVDLPAVINHTNTGRYALFKDVSEYHYTYGLY